MDKKNKRMGERNDFWDVSARKRDKGKIVISRGYIWERELKWIPNSKMAMKTRLQSYLWQISEAIVGGGKSAKPNV